MFTEDQLREGLEFIEWCFLIGGQIFIAVAAALTLPVWIVPYLVYRMTNRV